MCVSLYGKVSTNVPWYEQQQNLAERGRGIPPLNAICLLSLSTSLHGVAKTLKGGIIHAIKQKNCVRWVHKLIVVHWFK